MDTKTDRELIELAAKSMGYTGRWCDVYQHLEITPKTGYPFTYDPTYYESQVFQLIAHHKMGVHFEMQMQLGNSVNLVEVYHSHDEDGACICELVAYKDDPNKALKRAVLLAAAKIGEGME